MPSLARLAPSSTALTAAALATLLAGSASAQLPAIDTVTPTFAPFPSVITITGDNLANATSVQFGAQAGVVIGSAQNIILASVPPSMPGLLDITITTPLGASSAPKAAEFFPNLEVAGGTLLGGPLELTLRNGAGGFAILAYSFSSGAPLPFAPWHYGLELGLGTGFKVLGNFPVPSSGVGTVPLELPIVPGLIGQDLFFQSFSTLQPAGFLIGGSFSDTESVTVTGFAFEPPANLAYKFNPVEYELGAPIDPNLPTLDSFADVWSVAPALPAGLVLDAVNGSLSGTPTALAPEAAYTITASNPLGSTTVDLLLAVVDPPGGLIDPNGGGTAAELRIAEVLFGRSVDVYSEPTPGAPLELVYADFPIGPAELGQPGLWRLERGLASGRERMIVSLPNTPAPGEPFDAAVEAAAAALQPLAVQAPLELGMGFVPRNACLVVRFDDLIDVDTFEFNSNFGLKLEDVQDLFASTLWPRTRFDPNWGGFSGLDGSFQPTRLIVDLTVDPTERFPPFATTVLPENGVGMPAAGDALTNIALRFATVPDPAGGVFEVLRNLGGAPLASVGNGPTDPSVATFDVLRAFRSGSDADAGGGFLPDALAPRLLAELDVRLENLTPDPTGVAELDFTADVVFLDGTCAFAPLPGDGFRNTAGLQVLFEVTTGAPLVGTTAAGVRLRIEPQLSFAPGAVPLEGRILRVFDPLIGIGTPAACLLRDAIALPGAVPGVVDPVSVPTLTFDKPMSADALGGNAGALQLWRVSNPLGPTDIVPAGATLDGSARRLFLEPLLPLAHSQNAEDYFVKLLQTQGFGLEDLAGQRVEQVPPTLAITVDPTAAAIDNGGWVLRFDAVDEGGPLGAELSGNFTYDLTAGEIRPRPVTRFSAVVDDVAAPGINAMFELPTGSPTPLSGLGAKLHHVWRGFDLGLVDSQRTSGFEDLDLEGLALALPSGVVVPENYPEFEILAGHSTRLPDEWLDPTSMLPLYPVSGFRSNATFAENYFDDAQVLHERSLGFAVSALDVFQSSTAASMLALPLNRDAEPGTESTFTWRDTSLRGRGATLAGSPTVTDGSGLPSLQELALIGSSAEPGEIWGGASASAGVPAGVPSVGLPLLLEYRCFPSSTVSLNSFRAALATSASPNPFFRAFSRGGFDTGGAAITKDPDLEPTPTGGFNGDPAAGQLGAPTPPRDSTVFLGQADFVIRVSRVHTSLQPALGFDDPDYRAVLLDANGTAGDAQVLLAFRGHDTPLPANQPAFDADQLDVYGNLRTGPLIAGQPTLFPPLEFTTPDWSDDIDALDGTGLLQVRITFVNDLASGLSPSASALGVAYE